MTDSPDRRESIFTAAVEIPDIAERDAYLAEACADSPEMRAALEALLRAHFRADHDLDRPAAAELARTQPPAVGEHGGVIVAGRYKLLEAIGEGGMGTVWVAEQMEPVRRKVALKLIKIGMDSRTVLARFEAERQALAVMDHPNIAKVLDGGLTESGRPFFVMEYVKGVPITQYCNEKRLSVPERLQLFAQVCQAVQHAHQKGIIHRDLKPSNILVAPYDDRPVPKVIDFGLAKAVNQSLTDLTLHTGHGIVLGTPLYMSPEQAQLNNLDIDTRSDIYSLGVLLYELLTGSTPLEKQRFKDAAWDEVCRLIREEEPPRPSLRLSSAAAALPSLAAARHVEPARLAKIIRGELDWIVMKSLDKDRKRRYETASGFAADIQRYLDGDHVQAAPPSTAYQLQKFVRRHRGQVLAVGLLLMTLLAGVAGTTWGLIDARKQQRLAQEAQRLEAAARQREGERAESEAKERRRADAEKDRALRFRDQALDALRAMTSEDVEKLIGSRTELTANERAYLEAIANRWIGITRQMGTAVETRKYQIEGHFRVALLWRTLGRLEESRDEFRSSIEIQQKLVDEFPTEVDYQQDLATSRNNLGNVLSDLSDYQGALQELNRSRELYQKLANRFPQNADYRRLLGGNRSNLANLLLILARPDEALVEARAANALYQELLVANPSSPETRLDMARSHNNFGMLLSALDLHAESLSEYQAARKLQLSLVAQFPNQAIYEDSLARTRGNLAVQLVAVGRPEEGLAEYRLACELKQKLAEQFPGIPEFAEALALTRFNLSNLFRELGKLPEARTELEAAREIRRKLVAQNPAAPAYQNYLSDVHLNLGNVLGDLQEFEAARAELDAALKLRSELARRYPAVVDYQSRLAEIHANLGAHLDKAKDLTAAQAELEAALAIYERLHERDPTSAAYQQDLSQTHDRLGTLFTNQKRKSAAAAEYALALQCQEKLVAQYPDKCAYRVELGGSYCNYAILISRSGERAESLPWFDRAVATLSAVLQSEPQNRNAKRFLRNSYWSRAQAYGALNRQDELLRDWDQVVALSLPDERPQALLTRARSRLKAAKLAEAVADVVELTKSDQWSAYEWYDFACIHSVASGKIAVEQDGNALRAMELLRLAVKNGYGDVEHIQKDPDLDALRERDDFKALLAEIARK